MVVKSILNCMTNGAEHSWTGIKKATKLVTKPFGIFKHHKPNEGQAFDNWVDDSTKKQEEIDKETEAKILEFDRNNPGDENKANRTKFAESAANKAQEEKLALPGFSFAGNDIENIKSKKKPPKKGALEKVYIKDLLKLSRDTIANEDTNHDGVASYEEFKAKELADLKKSGQAQGLDEATIEEVTRRSFNAIDLNGDGKIDEKEQAAVYAAMDADSKSNGMDGNISQRGYMGTSMAMGDPEQSKEVQKKFQAYYNFLFKAKPATN